MTSSGKRAIRNAAIKAVSLSFERRRAILYVRMIFSIEKKKGKMNDAVSLNPNILKDSPVRKRWPILTGHMG
jgi:hypothetical protein